MRDQEKKVTVFFSCYNHGKYVSESLDSILNQTYRNIEVFIVDDGSSDNSKEVISSYLPDSRIRFVSLETNTGAIGAYHILNQWIFDTDSDYIAGTSSDDKWELDKLEKQINFLETNPSYKACFTWDKIIHEDNATKGVLSNDYSHIENMDRFKYLLHFLCTGNFLNACSMVMKRDIYIELGGYNWAYRNLQDFDLWLKLALKYPFYIMPEPLTFYRRHENNISNMSMPTTIRLWNEGYQILNSNYIKISNNTFRKAFENEFIYHVHNQVEVLAEKIVFLLKCAELRLKQTGIALFIEHSQNDDLLSLLAEKYSLSVQRFHQLTGSSGFFTFSLSADNQNVDNYNINDLQIFTNYLKTQSPELKELYHFHYMVLSRLKKVVLNEPDRYTMLKNIMHTVWQLQDALDSDKKNKIIYLIVDEDHLHRIPELQLQLENNDKEIVVVVLPKEKDMFYDNALTLHISCSYRQVPLFDPTEHRIRGFWEINEQEPDDIYLWGCNNKDYPILDVLNKLSLSTRVFILPDPTDNLRALEIDEIVRIC